MEFDHLDIRDCEDRIVRSIGVVIELMMGSPSQEIRDAAELLDFLYGELCVYRLGLRSARL